MRRKPLWTGMALVVGALLASSSAWPCLTTPPRYRRPHAQVVDEAKQIFLAKVVGHRPVPGPEDKDAVFYSLRVLRVLKGALGARVSTPAEGSLKVGATIQLPGDRREGADTTFSDHSEPRFWQTAVGRLGNGGDCVPMVTFEEGSTYLVFLGDPDDTKDLERVESDKDRWLTFVAQRLAPAR
jgi:hypothetical protein